MGNVTRTRYGCSKTIQLTNDEIKALPTTLGAVLVPAIPDAVLQVIAAIVILSPWVADYTNIDPLAVIAVDITGPGYWTPGYKDAAKVLAAGHAAFINWIDTFTFDDALTAIANLPIQLFSNNNNGMGDYTGGDPASILTVQVFYNVIRFAV